MKGVLAVCLLYAGLPVLALWLLAFLSNGFPIVPVMLGVGFLIVVLTDRG
jgi:hypothetical protein